METIITILASLGGFTIIIAAMLPWLGKLLENKINLKWEHDYSKELEYIKAKISLNQELMRTTLNSFSYEHNFSQERRLIAIETMWKGVLNIREFVSPISTFYSVLLPEEYISVLDKDKDYFLVSDITEKRVVEFSKKIEHIEHYRPFSGEYIWGLYFAYRAFMMRLVFLFQRGREKRDIKPWNSDKHLMELLRTSIGKDIYEKLDLSHPMSILHAISAFEQKILVEQSRFISGELAANANLNQAKMLMEVVMEGINKR